MSTDPAELFRRRLLSALAARRIGLGEDNLALINEIATAQPDDLRHYELHVTLAGISEVRRIRRP